MFKRLVMVLKPITLRCQSKVLTWEVRMLEQVAETLCRRVSGPDLMMAAFLASLSIWCGILLFAAHF